MGRQQELGVRSAAKVFTLGRVQCYVIGQEMFAHMMRGSPLIVRR